MMSHPRALPTEVASVTTPVRAADFERLAGRQAWADSDRGRGPVSHFPDGRDIGSVGKVGCLSLSVRKIITTGEGGRLISNGYELAQRLRMLKDSGCTARRNGHPPKHRI
jgi:hypothetical protein